MLPFGHNTITVYNAVTSQDKETLQVVRRWFRYVLKNCTWSRMYDSTLRGSSQVQVNAFNVQIPEDAHFLPDWEWEDVPLDDIGDLWTGKVGTVVVLGAVYDELPDGATPNQLLHNYDGRAFVVQYFQNNTGVGVPLGHYVMRG